MKLFDQSEAVKLVLKNKNEYVRLATLDLAKDFGLNTIQTYVPWNKHEPKKGVFDFEGMLDLAAYLKLAQEKGLYVMLRCAPYICSEWDLGGLPSWLLKDR